MDAHMSVFYGINKDLNNKYLVYIKFNIVFMVVFLNIWNICKGLLTDCTTEPQY